MADEEFFINIDDPVSVKKSILETSKESIKNLQNFELFKDIRTAKIENIMELKKLMTELTELSSQLKSVLPKTSYRQSDSNSKTENKKVDVEEPESDLDKLEKQLATIEGKLDKLN